MPLLDQTHPLMHRSHLSSGRRHPGRLQSEQPADFNRNGWPTSIGMPGRHHRNTHLDLSQSPNRPFQNDEAVAVPIDDRMSEWHRVTVPAIRALGVQQVASRSFLNCSRRNLQRWMDPSNAPPRSLKLARIEKKIFNYAVGLGLFDAGRLEDSRSMLAQIPERVEQFRAEIAATTSRLVEVWGSCEAVAKTISTTVGNPITERSVKTWLEPKLLSQHPLAKLNRITVTLALAVAEHLDDSDRSGRAKFSRHDIDNLLFAVPRLFLKDNLP